MTDGSTPIHPIEGNYSPTWLANGLTKREYFAALAMQGICADMQAHMHRRRSGESFTTHVAAWAAEYADALIEALNLEAK